MLAAAVIYGMTLRFDYWSNAVEFLAVSIVLASCVLGWPLLAYLGAGFVCGLGRETTMFLALLGTPAALCFGAGAAVSHGIVRIISRPDSQWLEAEENMAYGDTSMWRQNLRFFWSDPASMADLGIYLSVAALALFTAPWLTVVLVGATFVAARIDEPRVLTMLIPAAAMTVVKLWQ